MLFLLIFAVCHLAKATPGTWTSINLDTGNHRGNTLGFFDGKIYCFGGRNESLFDNQVYIFDENGTFLEQGQTAQGMAPRAYHTWTHVSTGALVIGGEGSEGLLGDYYLFGYSTKQFILKGSLPENMKLKCHSAAADPTGEVVVIFGGIYVNATETPLKERDNTFAYVATSSLHTYLLYFLIFFSSIIIFV